ncbi:hypothetical protein BCR35DRAFT_330735 [Leucosporidium creatinivorum]|uniref:Uncharacterized protein n=1 Tax=Leucosporidium creatinivorum TaxID=106004 RepID=A0A1Y2FPW8_9BASI|nr:hypothetical protein BCR35DRAFT_330735 [Leucosporidium creatinivorum]
MFNSAFSAGGCTGIIEQWCSSSGTYETCCGVCAYTSTSGNGQILWAFFSTLAICITICLAAQEAWPILGGQALFVVAQTFVVWIMVTQDTRAIARWHASFAFVLSQSWVPIVTASFFSPIWAQNGTTPAKVHELELMRDVHEAEVRVRLAASASIDRREAKNLLEEAEFELQEQRQLESHLHKGLAVKAAIAGAVWLVILAISLWFMASYVWGGDYDFAEHPCEITDDVQSSLNGMKIFSWISLALGFVLVLAQTLSPILLKKGGAELYLDMIHPHFQKVGKALNGKAEKSEAAHKAAEKAERKRQNSDGKKEVARQQLVRDSEWVQRGATAIMFVFWAGGSFTIWMVASAKFLLQGEDPWTFGQTAPLVVLVPNAIALITSYRARNDAQISLANLKRAQQSAVQHA